MSLAPSIRRPRRTRTGRLVPPAALAAAALGAAVLTAGGPATPSGVPGAGVLRPAPAQLPVAATPTGLGLMTSDDNSASTSTASAPYNVAILKSAQYGLIPALRRANPGVVVLAYKEAPVTTSADYVYDSAHDRDRSHLPVGVGWAQANDHPGWFLQDTNGNRVRFADYPDYFWLDIGNAGYARAWADNVIDDARSNGFDGVMIDDVNDHLSPHLASGKHLADYPDDDAYAAATQRFLSVVGPRLQAAGVTVVANASIDYSSTWESRYTKWLSYLDGVLREHWTRPTFGSDPQPYTGGDWRWQMQQMQDVVDAGKMFLPVTHGDLDERAAQIYARASFLLEWDGGPSSYTWDTPSGDPRTPAWTESVGQPVGDRKAVGDAWTRRYDSGIVAVNPSDSAQTVALGGTYTNDAGSRVSSVRLASGTAMILTK